MRITLLLFLVCGASAPAETPVNETRSTLEKWVETRQLISRTRADWQADKELIEQSIQLFDRELRSMEEQMSKLGTNSAQVEKERMQAEGQLKESNASLDRAKTFAADFERGLVPVIPRLPAPLREILRTLEARMPTNSADTRMPATERIQAVVAMLNELDKFNSAVTIFSEKRKGPTGEEIAVETVYAGLGAAYFVNGAGDFAGMGAPGAQGWEWQIKPELAAPIREVIRIYRNERPARFISLPVTIQ